MAELKFDRETIIETMDRMLKRTFKMDFPWDWPAGVAFYGVSEAIEATGNEEYLGMLTTWVDKQLENGLPPWTVNAVSIGHCLITLYQKTEDEKYLATATEMAEFLKHDAARFADGIFQHTVSQNYDFPEQAWVDTMFMAGYFLVRMGSILNREDFLEDGLRQYHGHERFLQDRTSNLYYHGWDNLAQNNMSSIFWARGNAWAAYTMAKALRDIAVTDPSYMEIHDSLRDQLAALVRLQSEDGLWHTVLNNSESYEEVLGSVGIAAALIEFNTAIGSPLYNAYVQKSIDGLLNKVAEDGTLMNVSAGTAVMDSEEGYKNVSCRRIQGWGQGLGLAFFASVLISKY